MRTLLVCTDFSSHAYHAGRYAIVLATQFNIPNITLFHAYRSFAVATALPPHPDDESEQLKAINFQLYQQMEDLQSIASQDTKVLVRSEKMSLAENINQLCEEENAVLVIMGLSGKTGFERGLAGSNMIDVLRNSIYPVCIVPGQSAIASVTHILFTYDNNYAMEPGTLSMLNQTLSLLRARLTVLHVETEKNNTRGNDEYINDPVFRLLDQFDPIYKIIESTNIVESIFHFAANNNVSLIIAMPGNYNFFEEIIHRSVTQQLIYQSMVPVLSLHA